MTRTWPIWRSMLFVPSHIPAFIARAHERGADACILDLEDSVPVAQKTLARASISQGARLIAASGADVLARINHDPTMLSQDLAATVIPEISALMLPKVEAGNDVRTVDALMSELELERNLPKGQILLIAQIEHVRALPYLDEIATSSPRLMAMILGSEDFSVSAGMEPTYETLYAPNQHVVFACRRAGILPLGFPGSISIFRNLRQLGHLIQRAREMGFVGSYAIHPDQIPVMNELFSPSTEERDRALELLTAWHHALEQERGALEFRGRMVDPPVVARAEEVVRRYSVCARSVARKKLV